MYYSFYTRAYGLETKSTSERYFYYIIRLFWNLVEIAVLILWYYSADSCNLSLCIQLDVRMMGSTKI